MSEDNKFGPSLKGHFPDDMRRQLWPLCCGASILSGFKKAAEFTNEQLSQQIKDTMEKIPDFQVFSHEALNPSLTFLTLNQTQMGSAKIMKVVEEAGFVKFAEAKPRAHPQGFFVRDDSKTFKLEVLTDKEHAPVPGLQESQ